MPGFTVYPAIDLRAGKVVRLKQGDPNRQTIYTDDPAAVARNWIEQGASWLHVVDLSGAFGETAEENQQALEELLKAVGGTGPAVKVQFGGGLRSPADVERLLYLGVSRVILGTMAVSAPDLVQQAVARFGAEAVAVAVDARHGKVRVQGWRAETDLDPLAFASRLSEFGVRTVVFTNISRDGVGQGADVKTSARLSRETGLAVIAAGGVNALADIRKARQAKLSGVVVGRALYEGRFTLKEALEC
jgi:phosphoribosylformimino-5-aminoimidazole carboxamide ribotide isomerase